MSRPAIAKINLSALVHNYLLAKRLHGGRALAVIKANAYGHGALHCAEALSVYADGFAVAFLEEAIPLRNAQMRNPILLLEGTFDPGELKEVIRHHLWIVVQNQEQIRMIESAAPKESKLHVWLKINSGMNRAGFDPCNVGSAYRRLMSCGKVAKITLMSHFACADQPEIGATEHQIASFDTIACGFASDCSLSNSAAILTCPASYRDWARPGIILYGAIAARVDYQLRQVMTLESAVMNVRTIQPGESVGYGGTFVATRPTRVGLVAMGYADGYPRSVKAGTLASIGGTKVQVIGRVSMDMLTVDLTEIPDSGFGSRVVLWGEDISVLDVASSADTIPYELLSNVKRVQYQYLY